MMYVNKSEFINEVRKDNGDRNQIMKAIEEFTELNDVLLQFLNKGKLNREHLIEEVSDALLMIDQLRRIYNIADGDVYIMQQIKMNRYKERKSGKKRS